MLTAEDVDGDGNSTALAKKRDSFAAPAGWSNDRITRTASSKHTSGGPKAAPALETGRDQQGEGILTTGRLGGNGSGSILNVG